MAELPPTMNSNTNSRFQPPNAETPVIMSRYNMPWRETLCRTNSPCNEIYQPDATTQPLTGPIAYSTNWIQNQSIPATYQNQSQEGYYLIPPPGVEFSSPSATRHPNQENASITVQQLENRTVTTHSYNQTKTVSSARSSIRLQYARRFLVEFGAPPGKGTRIVRLPANLLPPDKSLKNREQFRAHLESNVDAPWLKVDQIESFISLCNEFRLSLISDARQLIGLEFGHVFVRAIKALIAANGNVDPFEALTKPSGYPDLMWTEIRDLFEAYTHNVLLRGIVYWTFVSTYGKPNTRGPIDLQLRERFGFDYPIGERPGKTKTFCKSVCSQARSSMFSPFTRIACEKNVPFPVKPEEKARYQPPLCIVDTKAPIKVPEFLTKLLPVRVVQHQVDQYQETANSTYHSTMLSVGRTNPRARVHLEHKIFPMQNYPTCESVAVMPWEVSAEPNSVNGKEPLSVCGRQEDETQLQLPDQINIPQPPWSPNPSTITTDNHSGDTNTVAGIEKSTPMPTDTNSFQEMFNGKFPSKPPSHMEHGKEEEGRNAHRNPSVNKDAPAPIQNSSNKATETKVISPTNSINDVTISVTETLRCNPNEDGEHGANQKCYNQSKVATKPTHTETATTPKSFAVRKKKKVVGTGQKTADQKTQSKQTPCMAPSAGCPRHGIALVNLKEIGTWENVHYRKIGNLLHGSQCFFGKECVGDGGLDAKPVYVCPDCEERRNQQQINETCCPSKYYFVCDKCYLGKKGKRMRKVRNPG